MTTNLGKWMMGYGAFLVAMGLAGYLSNPEKAVTALMSGGLFGSLSILWGWLMHRGWSWSRWAALATTGLLTAVFAWRATVSWTAVAEGHPDKWVAAVLISAMGLASLAMLGVLTRSCCGVGMRKAATP